MKAMDLKPMVEKFVNLIEDSEKLYQTTLPKNIIKNKFLIYKILADHKNEVKILKPLELAKYRRYIRILSEITSLKMFSFCGQKYDINVLKGCLFDILLNRDPNFSCLKRGSQIMQFQFNNIISRDVGRGFFHLFFVFCRQKFL